MKTAKLGAAFLVFIFAAWSAHGQSTLFQNLNFESANPGSAMYALNVPVTSALPDWSVSYGTVQQTEINYNEIATGSTVVTLVSASNPFFPAIDGDYSVLLQGGVTASAASISQTGTIPSGTESLFFEAQPGAGTLNVLIGTQDIAFAAVGSGVNYTLYGANISAWAGDPEQLTFSALEDFSGPNNWTIDDISFSDVALAPEPNIIALTAIGGLLFGARKYFARRR